MSSIEPSYEWNPIEDLPSDYETISRPDLDEILKIWEDEKHSIRDVSKIEQLSDHLATRWAIETGIIERLYTLDRGFTETIVELGLDALETYSSTGRISKSVAKIIQDQKAALDFVFAYIKSDRELSLSYIKELHQLLLRNQETTEATNQFGHRFSTPLIRGDWKKQPNNPSLPDGRIHEYCPPEFVQDEMDQLIKLHHEHQRHGVRPEVEAAWIHHRFTQIHPFQDGNGRVARAIATMIFLKAGFLPLVVRDAEHRESYIQSLEFADVGDLHPLISLFANIMTQDINDSITFIRELRGEGINQIAIEAARAAKRRSQQDEEKLATTALQLLEYSAKRMEEIKYTIKSAFAEVDVQLDASVLRSSSGDLHWWSSQIVQSARSYRYVADTERKRYWVQLRLTLLGLSAPIWRVVVSLHHKQSRAGLMAAVVFLTTSEAEREEPHPLVLGSDNEFTFSSSSGPVEEDFRKWLEPALQKVLEAWQSRL